MLERLPSTLVRLWRLASLAAAALLLHKAARRCELQTLELRDAQAFFPQASALESRGGGLFIVNDAAGTPQGSLVSTSPAADRILGYSGPNNLLVALDPEGRIVGTKILESGDTPAHVDALRRSRSFAESLVGWTPGAKPPPKVEGIGGSTLTGLAMVEGIAERLGGGNGSLRFPEPVTIAEARRSFPSAADIAPDGSRTGWLSVMDSNGRLVGYQVRTAPASDAIIGYAGPTECLVAVEVDGQIIRDVRIRKSYDTDEYTERIVDDRDYLKLLTRWKVGEWTALDFKAEKIEGVAGATMTSAALAEGLRETFRRGAREKPGTSLKNLPLKDWVLLLFLAGACVMSFTRLRGVRWLRLAWQFGVIAGLGVWLGQFVSLGLLSGWASNGVSWRQVGLLVVLAGVALVVPWATRRQIYCHHICPHGAAQEFLGRVSPKRFHRQLPPSLHRILRLFPAALLICGFFWVLQKPGAALGNIEPFDFWILGSAAVLPLLIATVGLFLAAIFPMAYCRYGCPTGALLAFLRTTSVQERFSSRDVVALIVLLIGGVTIFAGQTSSPVERPLAEQTAEKVPLKEVRGQGFGSTWCVKVRGASLDLVTLRDQIASEIERIESTLSHWRVDSATSRFNRSTSTDYQEVPEELGRLVQFSQRLSLASSGAFDITVSPLVDAWGYGPSGVKSAAPSQDVLDAVLQRVGWEKLSVSADCKSLRKAHPGTSLDLGSVLQGYAVDQVAALLDRSGSASYLIEIGGELRARDAWTVAIENPVDASRPLLVMELNNAALATSGLARARRRVAGEVVSHIISPRTGHPFASDIEACSVRMPTCLEADGWATALISSGVKEARALTQREQLHAWVLDERGDFNEWKSENQKHDFERQR